MAQLEISEQVEQEKFIIDDLSKAEWAMKKIAHIEAKKAEIEQQAQKMKADIDQWLSDEIAEIEGDIEYFRAGLMPFLLSQIEGTKKKSIKLPSGKIGLRAGTVQYFIGNDKVDKDNQTLIDFAKSSAPEFVKTKETLDWAGLKKQLTPLENGKVVTKDGEIIENMWVVKSEDKFYVEVIKEAAI